MNATLRSMAREDGGAALVEYGLLIGFIALVALAAVQVLGTNLSTIFNTVANTV